MFLTQRECLSGTGNKAVGRLEERGEEAMVPQRGITTGQCYQPWLEEPRGCPGPV